MDLRLQGKIALVTGASKGIGLAVAARLVEEGAKVVTASRTKTPELARLDTEHVAVDLATPDGPAEAVARAQQAFGGLDLLVNNVGGVPGGSANIVRDGFLSVSDRDWERVLNLNFLAAVRTARAALPLLLEGGGVVINVSSGNARMPQPSVVDYSAAKAALTNLGQALSEEFAPQGVRVVTVSPGPVRTPLWEADGAAADAYAAATGTDRETAITTAIPAALGMLTGRFATPAEVADLIAFLASPLSASTTGSDVLIDGGLIKVA